VRLLPVVCASGIAAERRVQVEDTFNNVNAGHEQLLQYLPAPPRPITLTRLAPPDAFAADTTEASAATARSSAKCLRC
jgi:hypothetical protein